MKQRNYIIKTYCKEKGVPLWMLGEKLGFASDVAFCKRLRTEFTDKEISEAKKIVDKIAKEK